MFEVTFWGVRGSIPCPNPEFMQYGGNTSCVSIRSGTQHIVLDAGSGIRDFGRWFAHQQTGDLTLLLSHTHWDHINGFPFFSPAFNAKNKISVMAGHLKKQGLSVEKVLSDQMASPTFPVPLESMSADMRFVDFEAGESFTLDGGVHVSTIPLNHPNLATGYRLEIDRRVICYVTDTEHVPGTLDKNIVDLIQDADLVIYDSSYTDEEFPGKVGWGHSTWQEGVRLCRSANAKKLCIFHHDPDHDDAFMHELESLAHKTWPGGIIVARDRLRLLFSDNSPEPSSFNDQGDSS